MTQDKNRNTSLLCLST